MSIILYQASFGYGEHPILNDLNVCMVAGMMTAVLGANGAGKSTLLKGVLGLVPCLSGDVAINGQLLAELSLEKRATQLAYLEQNADCHWPLRAQKVIELGRFPHRLRGESNAENDLEAVAAAMQVTDTVDYAQRPVNQLSGGERARVMLARALAVDAPVLLVDEPVAGLDPEHQLTVLSQLQSWASQGRTLLVVLHDLNMALRFCVRTLLIMPDGQVLEGLTRDILTPDNIAKAFNITVIMGEHEQQSWLVPWRVNYSNTANDGLNSTDRSRH